MKNILILALALITILAVACSSETTADTPELIELTDWQSYTVMRPDVADQSTISSAQAIVAEMNSRSDSKIKLTTDWVNRGESVPTGTKEILIGATNRPESDAGVTLRRDDYMVKFENGRLAIIGGSGDAVLAATDWYIENCVGDEFSYPSEPYVYTGEYPLSAVKIDGVPLSDFTLDAVGDAATEYADSLFKLTGLKPSDKSHTLSVTPDESIGYFDIAAKSDGTNVNIRYGALVDFTDALGFFDSLIEKRTSDDISIDERMTLDMENVKILPDGQLEKWRTETDARIDEIRSSPNMKLPDGAIVYYVSPDGNDDNDGRSPETAWKSLNKVNTATVVSNSYICFERGGVWRGQLKAKSGITYTAYGEGAKPTLYGSTENGADPSKWTKTDTENVWVYSTAFETDIGVIVFDGGKEHAIKKLLRTDGSNKEHKSGEHFTGYKELKNDLDFFHGLDDKKIYLYSEKNPGERFTQIEFSPKLNGVQVGTNNRVTVDNFRIMYVGAHGVGAGTVKDLTVTNCEFGWIGGTIQFYENGRPTRYGNAVEIYGGCENFTVTDNYIYQVYDAGITQQVRAGGNEGTGLTKYVQKGMNYSRNVIEYCNYSIEYFLSRIPEGNDSYMEDFTIADNLMWYAGSGFCEQRPDPAASHIKGWIGDNRNRCRSGTYHVTGNLFVGTTNNFVEITTGLENPDGTKEVARLKDNSFCGEIGDKFGALSTEDFTSKPYGTAIPDYLGDRSDGDMFWIIPSKAE